MLLKSVKLSNSLLCRTYYRVVPNIYYKQYAKYRREIKDSDGNLIGYIWDIKEKDKMKYDELERMMIKETLIFVDI